MWQAGSTTVRWGRGCVCVCVCVCVYVCKAAEVQWDAKWDTERDRMSAGVGMRVRARGLEWACMCGRAGLPDRHWALD